MSEMLALDPPLPGIRDVPGRTPRAASAPSLVPDEGRGALVSCVVAAFNSAQYVEAIRSVLAQTHRPIEVMVVDDGSQDATPELAAAFGDPVRMVAQKNSGAGGHAQPRPPRDPGGVRRVPGCRRPLAPGEARAAAGALRGPPQPSGLHRACPELLGGGQHELVEHYRDHRRMGAMPGYATTTLLARRSAFEAVGGSTRTCGSPMPSTGSCGRASSGWRWSSCPTCSRSTVSIRTTSPGAGRAPARTSS